MYGLEISEDDEFLVETLHSFAEAELRTAARDAEHEGRTPASVASSLHRLGVAAPVAEVFGGQGVPGLATILRIAEELAWGDPGIAHASLTAGQVALIVAACGTPEQQARHLPRFGASEPLRASLALHEGFGRQPSEVTTRATRTGDGWAISGTKVGVLHPNDAEFSVVVAREAGGELAAFVCEGTPKGWEVVRDDAATGKLALDAAPTGVVRFDELQLPGDARLGNASAIARVIAQVRLVHASMMVGCARASKEFAQGYANERVAFGRPIAAFQGVAFPIADCDMLIDAARLELFDAAEQLVENEDVDLERLCAAVVGRCGEVALRVTREGVQTLGGHGFIREYPVERWYRAAAALSALDFDPLHAPCDFLSL